MTPPRDGPAHVLLVDDDRRLRSLLTRYLRKHGYRVTAAANALEAGQCMNGMVFDLLVLDVMMPGENGLDFASRLRAGSSVPILMLTALGEPRQRIDGLARGVDDYLVKPFEPEELLLRITGILRRVEPPPPPGVIRMGACRFDPARGELRRDGGPVFLTTHEAKMLELFARRPGHNFTRQELSQAGGAITERSVDVRINRLRRKLEEDPAHPVYLQTVRGVGYVLKPDAAPGRRKQHLGAPARRPAPDPAP